MNMNDWRNGTIALLLSRYMEDEKTEREQERAELESMTDEELGYALAAYEHELEREWQAEKMEILEERGA